MVKPSVRKTRKVMNGDLNQCCRVCMSWKSILTSAFDTEPSKTVEQLKYCTGVLLSKEDGLPVSICKTCLYNLSIAYKFKTQCLKSDQIFREALAKKATINDIPDQKTLKKDDKNNVFLNKEITDKLINKDISIKLLKGDVSVKLLKKSEDRNGKKILAGHRLDECLNRIEKKPLCKDISDINQDIVKIEIISDDEFECKKEKICKTEVDDDHVNDDDGLSFEQTLLKEIESSNITNPISRASCRNIPARMNRLKRPKKAPVKRDLGLVCGPCDLKFPNKALLLEHKRDVHDCEWVCEICGKQFLHRASHYSHKLSHLPPRYLCDKCDYKTWNKNDMNKHNKIHAGIKNYFCEFCSSPFRTVSSLHDHIRRHHVKVKTHKCTRCGRDFYTSDKLKRHMDSHDNVKRFECELCHSHFTRRCHWKKHLLKQHSVVVPRIRPGRKQVNYICEKEEKNDVTSVFLPANSEQS